MNKLPAVSVELNHVNIGVPDCNIPPDKGITVSVHFTHRVCATVTSCVLLFSAGGKCVCARHAVPQLPRSLNAVRGRADVNSIPRHLLWSAWPSGFYSCLQATGLMLHTLKRWRQHAHVHSTYVHGRRRQWTSFNNAYFTLKNDVMC